MPAQLRERAQTSMPSPSALAKPTGSPEVGRRKAAPAVAGTGREPDARWVTEADGEAVLDRLIERIARLRIPARSRLSARPAKSGFLLAPINRSGQATRVPPYRVASTRKSVPMLAATRAADSLTESRARWA